ncbi:hypothetical protein [Natronincola ferrireducens]|uniref:Uncharacterized protein n=1 Tax=Natronincola ferrireducens TaxID=393762 RepID=A0A1G9CKQ8_9FIRM|nr:hypothetical protein [Natronincola ferrireducens]SDK52273.1 hypothetical protein SAMN05660472_01492 [Natronincola ferrireducens]
MIKIAHVEEAKRLTELPHKVVEVVRELVEILDSEYGEYGDVDGGENYTNTLILLNSD